VNSCDVSLLIPCHNAARFLPRLLPMVHAQTQPFAHILAYDDGSTDETVRVARELGLTIITGSPNRGVAHARNRLVAAATTEWVHFHDADDEIVPDFVARLAALADASHAVVSCDADWLGEYDRGLQVAWRYAPTALANDPAAHLLSNPMSCNCTLLRKSAWAQVNGCDERLAIWEDADVHFRIALSGVRWAHLPAVLTNALRRPASFSHDYARGWRCRLLALQGYASLPAAARLRSTIASEAEKTAIQLLAHDAPAAAREAVALARSLGHAVPTTRNPLLRLCRAFLPTMLTLRLQQSIRRAAARA
jgi:glycosyltransferase involved in cell wall biosynthesis